MTEYIYLYPVAGLCVWAVAAGQAPEKNKNFPALILDLTLWPVRVIGNLLGTLVS
jgi:hypothetical protein